MRTPAGLILLPEGLQELALGAAHGRAANLRTAGEQGLSGGHGAGSPGSLATSVNIQIP